MIEKQKEILDLILFKGDRPANEKLRYWHGLLTRYSYPEHELYMIEFEVKNALPKWRKKQLKIHE